MAVVVADLVEYQASRGWDVHVACPSNGWLSTKISEAGGRHWAWEASREPGPRSIAETRSLRSIVEHVRPGVVHLHSSKAGLSGRLAIRGRTPTVFSPHAWSFWHVTGPTYWAALSWERYAVRWADLVLCGSEGELLAGREAGVRGPFAVIPNSSRIDSRGITPVEARSSLGLDPSAPLAVCFGRYAHQKGQDVLLRAWPNVVAAVPQAQLFLVGSGPEEGHLRSIAPTGVRFAPADVREDVIRWLLAADVLAFPSRWETLSLAVLEALELGKAVVVSDCEGMSEALAGGPGTMVPRDSPEALAEALVPLLADRRLAEATGRSAAEHFAATHGRARSYRLDAHMELLEGLIEGRR